MKSYQWQTVGHEKIIKFLQKNIDHDKLAHAYLFSGKANLGKRLLADEFMNSILCADYQEKNNLEVKSLPCQDCVFCRQFTKGIHPDVYFLKREEDKKNITVDQVREMQKILHLASFLNSYKIAVIDQAEDLNEQAQNALLKILEEPKQKTILLLLVSDSNLLLPTIVSRCRLIKFTPLANELIYQHLLTLGANREQARIFTSLANGQIGLAIDLYKKPELFTSYIEKTNNFFSILNKNLVGRFQLLDDIISSDNSNVENANLLSADLDGWLTILRDLLVLKSDLGHLLVNLHFQSKLASVAGNYSAGQLIDNIQAIKKIKVYLNYNINPRLAVENLIINL